ncbi:DUF4931 domain-containing protein [Leuconostoc carnosum]|nr:DUF4931 domain-containing protein [Leuconostoc carnosum]KAA8380554.1 DUF4931 domain-containing protein [Leuconostoc carnosum]
MENYQIILKYWQEIQNNTKYHSVFSYKNFSPWSDDNLAHSHIVNCCV